MKIKTKIKILQGFMLTTMVLLLIFVWVIFPYILKVSRFPLEYYNLRKSISNGEMVIQKRDTSSILDEQIVFENKNTGARYRLYHIFPKKKEFIKEEGEHYEYLYNEQGDCICYKDNDEEVLKFIKTKK